MKATENNPNNLFPYQVSGIEMICTKYKDVLLADHPGAGKTCQAIIAADRIRAKTILVICPASLRENWRREFQKWSELDRFIYLIYGGKYFYSDLDHIVIASYDIVARSPEMFGYYDLLILDEVHYLKNSKASRTKIILNEVWNRCKKRICITGTPLPNGRAIEGYSLFSRLAPEEFKNWFEFTRTYCVKEVTRWGTNYNKSKNLKVLGEKCRRLFMIRRDREETVGQLPPLVRMQVPLSAVKPFRVESELDVLDAVEKNDPHFAGLRRELGVTKVKAAFEYLEDLLCEVEQVVVFAHHKEVIAELMQLMVKNGITFVSITGETPVKDRQAAVDDFQAGKVKVFLGSILAANTGITLTKASDVVFVEYDWVPENNTQAEGRCFRVGQKEITRTHYLCIPDSIDDKITTAILRKQRDITEVMGDKCKYGEK